MTSWETVSNLATASGTLILAVATFSSIRLANRSARAAEQTVQATERSVLAGLRPVIVPSRMDDRAEKIIWVDGHRTVVQGGCGYAVIEDGSLYLAMSLRNVNAGLGVLQGWDPFWERRLAHDPHADPEKFRSQSRDLYIPAGDVSFWHAAIRDTDDPDFEPLCSAVKERQPIGIDLLYTDLEGGQRTISRFALHPAEADERWVLTVSRHWNLDRPDPR
ncbi:MAG TPA: hypothetical protein VGX23_06175 [Actinocrinis sp.]|nr:hypothetical protein [Actinocrinis sp.]